MSNVTMGVSSLGQALTMSMGSVPGSDSDNELLETCLANTLQLDQDDDDIEVDDDDDENEDDDNEDDQFDEPVGGMERLWQCVFKQFKFTMN